jgi:hypothetical protein
MPFARSWQLIREPPMVFLKLWTLSAVLYELMYITINQGRSGEQFELVPTLRAPRGNERTGIVAACGSLPSRGFKQPARQTHVDDVDLPQPLLRRGTDESFLQRRNRRRVMRPHRRAQRQPGVTVQP